MHSKLSRANRGFIVAVALSALVGEVNAAPAARWRVRNATIWVTPTQKLENTDLVVADGKIVGLEPNSSAGKNTNPADIDGSGMVVTAGFIDVQSRLGLLDVGMVRDHEEASFEDARGVVFAAQNAGDGWNPRAWPIAVARTGGITSAIVSPQGGFISGTSVWRKLNEPLSDGTSTGDNTPVAMNAKLRFERSTAQALARLRELFGDAQLLHDNARAWQRNQLRHLSASWLDLQALWPVVTGKLPLIVNVHRASDIEHVVQWAVQQKIKLVIAGGTEAWMLAEFLAKNKVPVIVKPTDNLPSGFDRLNVRDDALGILSKYSIPLMISVQGDAHLAKTLRQECGNAVAFGLTWSEALAAVTTVPAKVFGLGRGTLEKGEAADFVVWSGDPFEMSTRAMTVSVDGVVQSLTTRQDRLRKRYAP